MRRGEVWYAALPAPHGSRPVVLLSRDRAYRVRTDVTVATVTRTVHGIPTEVSIGPADGMKEECVINLDVILTVPIRLIDRRITDLSPEKMAAVNRALRFALAIPRDA